MNRRVFGIVLCAGLILALSSPAFGFPQLTLTREVAGGIYTPGSTVDIKVTLTLAGGGTPLTLGVEDTLPANWTFNKMVTTGEPSIGPKNGDGGTLVFAWYPLGGPPTFPATFTYQVKVPPGESGLRQISGLGICGTSDFGEIRSVSVVTDLTNPTPTLSVTPNDYPVSEEMGDRQFTVSNAGAGTMSYGASVAVASASWLHITDGATGQNLGTGFVNVHYDANTTAIERKGTIVVTATGAIGSPQSVTVTQAPFGGYSLQGAVQLQGRPAKPDSSWVVSLVLGARAAGTTTSVFTGASTTDQNGLFTVKLAGVPAGSYEVFAKESHTLKNKVTITIPLSTSPVNFGPLLEGDADNKNSVGGEDFSILSSSYSKKMGDAGYDARADFTGDNAVDAKDFSLLSTNYGKSGAQE